MVFSGFPTQSFAELIGAIIERCPTLEGLYHVASAPISKLDLLRGIRDAMALPIEIEPVDGPQCDRSLDGSRFVEATGLKVPSWDQLIGVLSADPTPYDEWRHQHATA